MTHTSNERANETVLFAGLCVRETCATSFPFLADLRVSRKGRLANRKRFLFPSLQRQNQLLLCNEHFCGLLSGHVNTHNTRIRSLENPHEVLE
ncbi:hypothetical protein TNCV_3938161 [Trichonephila clavipes]|nr:hypothetical protein TNCV_3938161 [Trichonephila clavipes]